MKSMELTITQEHLDQAISEMSGAKKSFSEHCVATVAARELFPGAEVASALGCVAVYNREGHSSYSGGPALFKIQEAFDRNYRLGLGFSEVAQMLPITIPLEFEY